MRGVASPHPRNSLSHFLYYTIYAQELTIKIRWSALRVVNVTRKILAKSASTGRKRPFFFARLTILGRRLSVALTRHTDTYMIFESVRSRLRQRLETVKKGQRQ
jgi:hypothetical protein